VNTIRDDREAQAAEEQKSENVAVYQSWISKHPELKDCIATSKTFEEYMEGEDIWTEADLEFALSRIPAHRLSGVKQRVKTAAELVAEENARRKSLSREELGELARTEHPAPTASTLPLEITLPGRKTPTDISTPAALKSLARTNYPAFKYLNDKYGSTEINKRLGVKPTAQPGKSYALDVFSIGPNN
jgi:hypothetical protein